MCVSLLQVKKPTGRKIYGTVLKVIIKYDMIYLYSESNPNR